MLNNFLDSLEQNQGAPSNNASKKRNKGNGFDSHYLRITNQEEQHTTQVKGGAYVDSSA